MKRVKVEGFDSGPPFVKKEDFNSGPGPSLVKKEEAEKKTDDEAWTEEEGKEGLGLEGVFYLVVSHDTVVEGADEEGAEGEGGDVAIRAAGGGDSGGSDGSGSLCIFREGSLLATVRVPSPVTCMQAVPPTAGGGLLLAARDGVVYQMNLQQSQEPSPSPQQAQAELPSFASPAPTSSSISPFSCPPGVLDFAISPALWVRYVFTCMYIKKCWHRQRQTVSANIFCPT